MCRSCVALLLAVTALARPAGADVPRPLVEGPVTGGAGKPFLAATSFDLAQVGYTEEEFFISGTATAYSAAGAFTSDGRWPVALGPSAAYKTRIVVFRPADPHKFKGTVMVEWLNVSGGVDAAPDWVAGHVEMIRDGIAWVGVSAQKVGVEGGSGILGTASTGLKQADPVRYGSLVHPGDSFSYDIFSQAGEAARNPVGADPMGGLRLRRVIAIGESQSAFRLTTYVNAIHPVAGVYDGFLVHSRGGGGAALSEAPQAAIPVPNPARFRDDLREPVLVFETETDLTLLGYFSNRQPDTDHIRAWEVAGTAHADTYTVTVGSTDLGTSPSVADLVITANPVPGIITCGSPINSGPQHFVLDAALAALDRWVRRTKPPRHAPRLDIAAGPPLAILRDPHGNAVGGIRTSWVDAPLAALSGLGQTGSTFCFLFGTTMPFDPATLATLYPTHAAYVSGVRQATNRAVRMGFLRRADARLIKLDAAASAVGG